MQPTILIATEGGERCPTARHEHWAATFRLASQEQVVLRYRPCRLSIERKHLFLPGRRLALLDGPRLIAALGCVFQLQLSHLSHLVIGAGVPEQLAGFVNAVLCCDSRAEIQRVFETALHYRPTRIITVLLEEAQSDSARELRRLALFAGHRNGREAPAGHRGRPWDDAPDGMLRVATTWTDWAREHRIAHWVRYQVLMPASNADALCVDYPTLYPAVLLHNFFCLGYQAGLDGRTAHDAWAAQFDFLAEERALTGRLRCGEGRLQAVGL